MTSTIEKLKNAKPDLSVLRDYKKREEEFLRRAKDLDQITDLRDAQKQRYDNLRKQRLDEFMAGFSLISLKLKEMYQVRVLMSLSRETLFTVFVWIDDHSGRKCRTGVGRQHGSVLRGYHL